VSKGWPTLPVELLVDDNAAARRFLSARPSAHSDVVEVLERAVARCPGVQLFCPEPASFAYVAAYRADRRIFAVAFGMRGVACRVGPERAVEALAAGAAREPALGADWVVIDALAGTVEAWVEAAYRA
jgi:hypothetical protein